MAYATKEQFRALMDQVDAGGATDDLIDDLLDRASSYFDLMIGHSFSAAAEDDQVVYSDGTDYLILPAFTAGSVSEVAAPSGYTVPDYVERGGALLAVSATYAVARYPFYGSSYMGAWGYGVPYTVTADWGYGIPEILVQGTLELAVDMWHGRDTNYSGVVGVDGQGAVIRSKNQRVIDIIKALKQSGSPLRIA